MEVTRGSGGMTRSARISIFVNVVLICVLGTILALTVIWLVGRLAWKHDLRADLTRDARFTIDPLAVDVLRALREPVHATFVFGIDEEISRRALDLAKQPRQDILDTYYRPVITRAAARVQVVLSEWSRVSELFTSDVIDADLDPGRMTEVAQRRGRTAADLARGINQVVLEMGSRRRSVPMGRMFSIDWGWFSPDPRGYSHPPEMLPGWHVQSELTEMLRALATGESLKIGFPKGVGSALSFEGSESEPVRDFLVSQGFEPVPFDLAQGVPVDLALVALVGIGRRLLPEEVRALDAYESRAGRLLLLADPARPEDFASVLDEFGVIVEAGRVEDPARQRPGQTSPWVLLSDELCVGQHEIDRPLVRRIGIHLGTVRPLRIENLKSEGAERVALLQGSNDAKVVPIEYREQTGEPDYLTAAKKTAPRVVLAAALRRPVGTGKESRVVVAGGWEVAEPRHLLLGTHYGNRDLFLNSLNWLAERHAAIGIVEREVEGRRVELNPGFVRSFRLIAMLGLPALLLLGGFVVWLTRRN